MPRLPKTAPPNSPSPTGRNLKAQAVRPWGDPSDWKRAEGLIDSGVQDLCVTPMGLSYLFLSYPWPHSQGFYVSHRWRLYISGLWNLVYLLAASRTLESPTTNPRDLAEIQSDFR